MRWVVAGVALALLAAAPPAAAGCNEYEPCPPPPPSPQIPPRVPPLNGPLPTYKVTVATPWGTTSVAGTAGVPAVVLAKNAGGEEPIVVELAPSGSEASLSPTSGRLIVKRVSALPAGCSPLPGRVTIDVSSIVGGSTKIGFDAPAGIPSLFDMAVSAPPGANGERKVTVDESRENTCVGAGGFSTFVHYSSLGETVNLTVPQSSRDTKWTATACSGRKCSKQQFFNAQSSFTLESRKDGSAYQPVNVSYSRSGESANVTAAALDIAWDFTNPFDTPIHLFADTQATLGSPSVSASYASGEGNINVGGLRAEARYLMWRVGRGTIAEAGRAMCSISGSYGGGGLLSFLSEPVSSYAISQFGQAFCNWKPQTGGGVPTFNPQYLLQ